jgi:hypothetical protein
MFLPSPRHLRYVPRILFYAAVLYCISLITRYPEDYDDDEYDTGSTRHYPKVPPADKVVWAIRSPGVDVYRLLPTNLLLTKHIYHDNTLLFSDIEMDIGGFHVHDLLEKYDPEFVARNPEFERYRSQMMYSEYAIELHDIKEEDEEKERKIQINLDRYKYLRMLERTWAIRPERMWYVFMEANAYIVRPNLMKFLGQFDPEGLHFFGNEVHRNAPNPFGHGGSTFVLSAAAMRRLFGKKLEDRDKSKDGDRDKENDALLRSWLPHIAEMSLGHDILTAFLSSELSLTMNASFPQFTGFNPSTVPYGPGLWCEPVIGLQGLRPEDMSDMWRFERDRIEKDNITSPMSFSELYAAFVKPQPLVLPEEDWDNMSSDESNAQFNILFGDEARARHIAQHMHHGHGARQEEVPVHINQASSDADGSFESCREACNQHEQCLQYSFSSVPTQNYNGNGETKCHLSRRLRFGVHKFPEEIERDGEKVRLTWKSGWRKDRLERWAEQESCLIRKRQAIETVRRNE